MNGISFYGDWGGSKGDRVMGRGPGRLGWGLSFAQHLVESSANESLLGFFDFFFFLLSLSSE